ncbi:MAG TPA: DUF6326 family protein [Candidatus Kapabacteria bacterium]|nr:hypothetical protein [Ignavibacteria bacterium]HRK59565.1 DUF6326 family protein [Candidatus Kapabacteria bacterium]
MNAHTVPEDIKVNVKLKLAALWTSLMFLIIYLDYFHLYMPDSLKDIIAGKVFVFDITQLFLLAALAMIAIPALMIFLSIALPATINRPANIMIAAINIPLLLFNLAGVAWIHMIIGAAIEIALLCLILYYAWKWPRLEA